MKSNFLRLTSLLIILFPSIVKAAVSVDNFINVTDKHHIFCQEHYFFKDLKYCSTRSIDPQLNVEPEILLAQKQKIIFDDRLWKPAWTERSMVLTSIGYFPVGQDLQNWNEVVVSQFIPEPSGTHTIQMFMESVIRHLQIKEIQPTISLLDSAPGQSIYELLLYSPVRNTVENELFKITRGPDGLYILRYVSKSANMGAENRVKWLNLLKQSEIRPQMALSPAIQ